MLVVVGGSFAGAAWTTSAETGVAASVNGVPLQGTSPRVPGCAVQVTVTGVAAGSHGVHVVVAAMEPSGTGDVVDVDATTVTGSLSVGPFDMTGVVVSMGLKAAGNGYHLRATVSVDGVQDLTKPFWLACGRPQHPGHSMRVTFAVSWRHLDGGVTSAPPPGLPSTFTLQATSSHGTATCTYLRGSSELSCSYPAAEEGELGAPPSLQVSGMGSYVVAEQGLPVGWAPDPATVGEFASDPTLPGAGTGGGDEGAVRSAASATGPATVTHTVTHTVVNVEQQLRPGYRLAMADGAVVSVGSAVGSGSTTSARLNGPLVGVADGTTGGAYWLVAADGGVFAFGGADFVGSLAARRLNAPVVGMASTPDGGGYWLVAADGGVFAFGDATFRGSLGASRPGAPVAALAAVPTGGGYTLVTSTGDVFTFGTARYLGGMGGLHLNGPVVAVTVD